MSYYYTLEIFVVDEWYDGPTMPGGWHAPIIWPAR